MHIHLVSEEDNYLFKKMAVHLEEYIDDFFVEILWSWSL